MIIDIALLRNAEITLDDYRRAIQIHLDAKAQERSYDDIKSAALRAGYPGPFYDEGVKYALWMDLCWVKAYQILDKVTQGKLNQPSVQELLSQMPELTL